MSLTSLFCPTCSTYFPSGEMCPHCGQRRPLAQVPAAPDQPLWRVKVPGRVASRLLAAQIDDLSGLIAPWAFMPSRAETTPPDGGVSIFDVLNGTLVWEKPLGVPIEGGAALNVETQTILVGLAARGLGAGEGWLIALDLRTGQERWRVSAGGAVESAPVVEQARVYVTAADGALHCCDARTGQQVWRTPVFDGQAVRLPASPVVVKERGKVQAILVGTYGRLSGREPGRLVAVDERGTVLWSVPAGGNVRGTPLAERGRVYVTAYRDQPSTGVLTAFDVRTGQAVWKQPFVLHASVPQAPDRGRGSYNLSASPLLSGSTLYVGSLDHHLYALDAATGQPRWAHDAGAGIATAPIGLEGLIVCGANNGRVYAVEAATGERVWSFDLANGAHVWTDTFSLEQGQLAVGTNDGSLALLPWHMGHYAWAAQRLEQAGRYGEAGDCYALAAHFQPLNAEQAYQQAVAQWLKAGEMERAAQLWRALDQPVRAATAYRQAGQHWQQRDPLRAARAFQLAAELFFKQHDVDAVNDCTRALARCLQRSHVQLEVVNVRTFIQGEAGRLTLRLTNEGAWPIEQVRLWLGGALESDLSLEIPTRLDAGQRWNIPVTITPTQRASTLLVEIEYLCGADDWRVLRGLLRIPIAAEKPDRPVQIGDVANLHVIVASRTEEGVEIRTHDVGLIRSSGGIDTVNVAGDVGAIATRGGDTNIGGDVVGRDKIVGNGS